MHCCHVCGAETSTPPWGEDGFTPLYEICQCCGCEFGYNDATYAAIEHHRQLWLATGGNWRDPKAKPPDLTREEQITRIPSELPHGILRNN